MRYILLVLFTLIATFASAQVQYLGSPTTTVRNRGNFVSDSLFYLPKRTKAPSDTGAIRYQISDSALYVWTGSAWRTAGTAGSAITGSGVAGYMPEFTTATNIDTTRLYHSAGRFAIGSTTTTNGVFNVIGGTTYLEGNLSFGAADRTISNISNNVLAFGTNNTERMRLKADGEVLIGTTTDAGAYALQVAGAIYNTTGGALAVSSGEVYIGSTVDQGSYILQVNGNTKTAGLDATTVDVNTSGKRARISTRYGANADGNNIWIGDGGQSSIGQSGQTFRGSENTSIGFNSMYDVTTGYSNAAFGNNTLQFMTTGYNNMAIGSYSLRLLSTGHNNATIGFFAGYNLTIGYQNVVIGSEALRFTNSGSSVDSVYNGVYIGQDARASAKTNNNEIVIGYQGRGNGSNTVTIGNSSTTDNYFTGSIRTSAPSGGSIKPWKIGEAATVSPTSPNRTIRVEIDGTVYYIHAKTTND